MPEFLAAMAPEVTILSSGVNNPYGHPSPELLARLTGSGARVLRTDTVGAVQVLTDGHNLQISCCQACPVPVAESAGTQIPDQGKSHQQ